MTDDPPPPHCAGCADYRAIYRGRCLEVPYGHRLAKREADRAQQRHLEGHALTHPATPDKEIA